MRALFGLLCLSSCTIIFSRLSPLPCEQSPPRCQEDIFISCQEGFELLQECPPGACDISGCIVCGDASVQTTEQCDDGNLTDGDGCDSNCTATTCGNGILTSPEQCDDGNPTSGDGCDSTCKIEAGPNCGNGILDLNEQCDNGGQNSDTTSDACRTNCTNPRCGDSVTDSAEQCDDGNATNADGCNSCILSFCGDGLLDTNERCDDSNNNNNDGCDSQCKREPILEREPNDSTSDADANAAQDPTLFLDSSRVISGIASVNDIDFFLGQTSANDVVRLEIFDGTGVDCVGLDSFLDVLDAGGTTSIVSDDDSGIGNCSVLVGASDGVPFFLEIDNNSPTAAAYQVEISFLSSAGAEIEPNDTIAQATTFAGNEVFILGNHAVNTEEDFFRISLSQTSSLRLEIIEGDFNKLCGNFEIDSVLTLLDAQGNAIVSDDDGGRGDCSVIDGTGSTPKDPEAHDLIAGTYFLKVSSAVASAAGSFAYRIALTAR